jgi:hypothetical protein
MVEEKIARLIFYFKLNFDRHAAARFYKIFLSSTIRGIPAEVLVDERETAGASIKFIYCYANAIFCSAANACFRLSSSKESINSFGMIKAFFKT